MTNDLCGNYKCLTFDCLLIFKGQFIIYVNSPLIYTIQK